MFGGCLWRSMSTFDGFYLLASTAKIATKIVRLCPVIVGIFNPIDLPIGVVVCIRLGCRTAIGADDFNIREITSEIVEGGDGLPDGVGDIY
jgi:hypothetical protein